MDDKQLVKFIRAIEADPGHAAYLLGLRHNAALQYHATNVTLIGAMSDETFLADAPKLFASQFNEVKRIATQCEQLAEALGKDPLTLQAVDLFQSVVSLAQGAQPAPESEDVKPADEAKSEEAEA